MHILVLWSHMMKHVIQACILDPSDRVTLLRKFAWVIFNVLARITLPQWLAPFKQALNTYTCKFKITV